jgi:trans-aconitate methyltransferase
MSPEAVAAFFEVHRGLEREGPGSRTSTLRALSLVTDLPSAPLVLDVGCGPGAQTVVLAEALPGARVIAVDIHEPYVDEVARRAAEAGVADRVTAVVGDMHDLTAVVGVGPEQVDLLWSEGAAYQMGFQAALDAWRPLLAPQGALALTEPVWIAPTVKTAVKEFWDRAYPPMQPAQVRRAQIAAAGYRRVGDFVLPPEDWAAYYDPLRERVSALRDAGASVSTEVARIELTAVLDAHDEELAVFDGGGAAGVSYLFAVMRRG